MEHIFQVSCCFRRAFNVFDSLDSFRHLQALFSRHWGHPTLPQHRDGIRILSKIDLVTDQDDGYAGAVMVDLGVPFLLDVVEGDGADDGETHEEHVGLWVGERSETVVVLLTSRVPQIEANELASNLHVFRVIVESAERERGRVCDSTGKERRERK